MPADKSWTEKVETKEDAVKRVLKRIKRLNEGVLGDLEKMHNHCHKQIEEGFFNEHVPSCFVRYTKIEETPDGSKDEVKEFFYICSQCLSKYIIEHPESIENFTILRGRVSDEAKEKAEEYWNSKGERN